MPFTFEGTRTNDNTACALHHSFPPAKLGRCLPTNVITPVETMRSVLKTRGPIKSCRILRMVAFLPICCYISSQLTFWIQSDKLTFDFTHHEETVGKEAILSPENLNFPGILSSPSVLKIAPSHVDERNRSKCYVLIDNHRVDHHLELLESIMAKIPLKNLPSICSQVGIDVDFMVAPGPRSTQWKIYADEYMRNKTYAGQRRLGRVFSAGDNLEGSLHYAINVSATCKCHSELVMSLDEDESFLCMLHDACPEVANHSRAYWFHPTQPQWFFPDIFPQFPRSSKVEPPYRLCTVGQVWRRNYGLMATFLTSSSRRDFTFTIMGRGRIPSFFVEQNVTITKRSPPSHIDYQREIATGCDVMLALVDTKACSQYFMQPKMTGSVIQASVYKIPFVVHEDLHTLFRENLKGQLVELHTDDPDSFTVALTKILDRLDEQNRNRSIDILADAS